MHFLEMICADIVFKFCSYAHAHINRGRGTMTFKGESKGPNATMPPKRPMPPKQNGTKSTSGPEEFEN